MKLSELIDYLVGEYQNLISEYGNGPESDPVVVLSSDEEGNSFYELHDIELTDDIDQDEPWLIFWPAGYDLSEC